MIVGLAWPGEEDVVAVTFIIPKYMESGCRWPLTPLMHYV